MRKLLALLLLAATLSIVPTPKPSVALAGNRPNVVIIMSDDQRWDKITPQYTPNIWALAHQTGSTYFTNSFVTNPLCCPSRTTVLSGKYSHTTGVWMNDGPYGGFSAFDDKHTIAVDFQNQGYRTAMVGKYLNGYHAGKMKYVPPGWTKWFADNTGAYYNWGVTTNNHLLHFGDRPKDYSTRVLKDEAVDFVTKNTAPFFLYFSLNAPHGPAIPDPRDVGRFKHETDFIFQQDRGWSSSMLESAYGVDRAVGQLLEVLPPNTIVLYMSDNGYMWHEQESNRGTMSGKVWPYNASIRVPMIFSSLNGSISPVAGVDDIVSNVDLRTTLLHAAGLVPLTSQEGINWMSPNYTPRDYLLIEHYQKDWNATYCGIRTVDYMYARFHNTDDTYPEELFAENPVSGVDEATNLVSTATALRDTMFAQAQKECDPAPPGYTWP